MTRKPPILSLAVLTLFLLQFTGCEQTYRQEIVGEWELVPPEGVEMQNDLEFTDDGEFVSTTVVAEGEGRRRGTYRIDGRKLYLKYEGKHGLMRIYEIKTLNRHELVLAFFGKDVKYRR